MVYLRISVLVVWVQFLQLALVWGLTTIGLVCQFLYYRVLYLIVVLFKPCASLGLACLFYATCYACMDYCAVNEETFEVLYLSLAACLSEFFPYRVLDFFA